MAEGFFNRALRHPLFVAGFLLVGVVSLAALLAPWIASNDPTALNVDALLQPPSAAHLFGTDALGRDVFSRMLHGGRVSLWVGFVAVGLSMAVGLFFGLIAGYFGGLADEVIMRGVDVMLCFPSFFLILAVIAFLEPSLTKIMAVIGLTSWMGVARLVRAEALTLKGARLRAGRPAVRMHPRAHRAHPYSAQRRRAGAGVGHPGRSRGHPGGIIAFVSWARRAAAHPVLGQHAAGRQRGAGNRPVAVGVSRLWPSS